MENLIKKIGGIVTIGLSLTLFGCGGNELTNTERAYLKNINPGLEGKVKILKSEKGRVVLQINKDYKIRIYEGVNDVYDDNVDLVMITDERALVLRAYQNIDFLPYKLGDTQLAKKMSTEDQKMWNSIYNRLADKDSLPGFGIQYHQK